MISVPSLILVVKSSSHLPYLQQTALAGKILQRLYRERSGSVVECLTRDRGAAGSSPTRVAVLCPSARTLILLYN